jgi:hypothetical protein
MLVKIGVGQLDRFCRHPAFQDGLICRSGFRATGEISVPPEIAERLSKSMPSISAAGSLTGAAGWFARWRSHIFKDQIKVQII